MSNQPLRHSGALLIAWRLAELEAANLRSTELEPVHFFLALLKLGELDVEAILRESTSLSDGQICGEAASVGQLAACFSQAGLETTQTRRRQELGFRHGCRQPSEARPGARGRPGHWRHHHPGIPKIRGSGPCTHPQV